MCIVFVLFNVVLFTFTDSEAIAKINHLNLIIGIVLTYIAPATMLIDQIAAVRNQRALPALFERIVHVDEGLRQLGISVDNTCVQRSIWLMIVLTVICEFYIFWASLFLLADVLEWRIALWVFTSLPTLFNTLDKIWFVGIQLGLRDRFEAINGAFDVIAEDQAKGPAHLQKRQQHVTRNEIVLRASLQFGVEEPGDIKLEYPAQNACGDSLHDQTPYKRSNLSVNYCGGQRDFDVLQERFISLCQLHDSTCRIAKLLNELWCYPILLLMAFSFLVFTSQLYFVYCAKMGQSIPLIFRTAKEPVISVVLLIYLSGKCVSLNFFSWKTSQASRHTGICLHRCGVAADTNEVYEIVNHLSLKLLNHTVNFSAFGFFTLDMSTLNAVCGAITSYLIILIQFNMAGQQVKISRELAATNETATTMLDGENYTATPFESTTEG
ncbi:gustatory receptor for bitter taste 66a-like [Anastrepha ludens]|uniref:gustatory receptor for bitter taste 66a-like n=1 Tax=Anastrepha ludens TaxID=28586 RepID=UPI0023AEF674|nr:gustatory receptor for bitter taste 66a-like [Anastrepha ludens]